MTERPLVYHSHTKKMFFVEEGVICQGCNKKVLVTDKQPFLFHTRNWSKKHSSIRLLCLDCLRDSKGWRTGTVVEVCQAWVTQGLPPDSIVVIEVPPQLTEGRYKDVFTAAYTSDGAHIINRAKVSREPWRNTEVGFEERQRRIAAREEVLGKVGMSVGEVEQVLIEAKNSPFESVENSTARQLSTSLPDQSSNTKKDDE